MFFDFEESREALYKLIAYRVTDNAHVKPIFRLICWNAVPLSMLVDTGSLVRVIPRSVFEQHHGKWPRLRATVEAVVVQEPTSYRRKIALQLNVTMMGKTIQAGLFIIDCPGPVLSGRDIILASMRQVCRTAGVAEKFLPSVEMVAGRGLPGARIATVFTLDGEQRRHADQLLPRSPKDTKTLQPGYAATFPANKTSPMQASRADPAPAGSPPSSQPEAPPPLRRS
ncbi:hypothetical protein MRX96_019451 [Rhipicephalus microplus]